MDLKQVGDIVLYLGAIAAALAAIGVVVHWAVVRPIKAYLKREFLAVNDKADAITDKAQTIVTEVTPDSGASIKDTVNRVDVRLEVLERRFSDHLRSHGTITES